MLEQFIIIIHVIAAIAIIALILLQHGKGADMGASFGSGASQTVLGVQGNGNLLTHSTAVLVAVFFLTSLSLGYFAKQKTTVHSEEIVIEDVVAEPDNAQDEVPVAAKEAAKEVPAAEVTVPAPVAEVPATEVAPAAETNTVTETKAAIEEIPE